MKRFVAVVTLVVISAPSLAAAPDEDVDTLSTESREVRYRTRTEIDFDKIVELKAGMVRPTVEIFMEHVRPNFNPLIRLRTDFTAEMKASVDQVR